MADKINFEKLLKRLNKSKYKRLVYGQQDLEDEKLELVNITNKLTELNKEENIPKQAIDRHKEMIERSKKKLKEIRSVLNKGEE